MAISQDCYLLHWWVTKALMSLHICTISSELSFSHNGHLTRLLLIALEWQRLWWVCTYAQSHQGFPSHIMGHLTRLLLIALEWQRLRWVYTYAQSHQGFPSHIMGHLTSLCYLLHWWVIKAQMSLHICTVSSRLSFSHNGPSHKIVTYCTGVTKAQMSLHICTVSSELSFSHNEPSHKIVTFCTGEWQRLWWVCTYAQSHQSFPSHIMAISQDCYLLHWSDKGSDESAHMHSLIKAFLLT